MDRVAGRRGRWETRRYIRRNMSSVPAMPDGVEVLDWALNNIGSSTGRDGLCVEFGVGTGGSLRKIAEHCYVYGFDSFNGLPEDWRNRFPVGYFALTPD